MQVEDKPLKIVALITIITIINTLERRLAGRLAKKSKHNRGSVIAIGRN